MEVSSALVWPSLREQCDRTDGFAEVRNKQVNAELHYELVMLVKGGATGEHAREAWQGRFQAMLSTAAEVQLQELMGGALDGCEWQVRADEDQTGKTNPDDIFTATGHTARTGNSAGAPHGALKDGTLATYPKVMEAARSFVRASSGWNAAADGVPHGR